MMCDQSNDGNIPTVLEEVIAMQRSVQCGKNDKT